MGCPHVRGDNPRALAGGLSYVLVDKHSITITIFITIYISVDLAHHDIFHAKVGKGGIMNYKRHNPVYISNTVTFMRDIQKPLTSCSKLFLATIAVCIKDMTKPVAICHYMCFTS